MGIGGFEFFAGIPGSLGGAIRMNAGAHGKETKDRVIEVRAIDREGRICTLSNSDLGFFYRHSNASENLIFTSVLLEGYQANADTINREMKNVVEYREKHQPLNKNKWFYI